MKYKSLKLIGCPDCHNELSLTEKITEELIQEGQLYCKKCNDYYPIIDGIPVLLKEKYLTESTLKKLCEKSGTFWYDLQAKTYEGIRAKIVSRLFGGNIFSFDYAKDGIEPTVNLLDIQESDTILDVACGTGLLTRPVARRVDNKGYVVGLDISFDMLRYARKYAEREGLDNIDLMKGDAENLPYKNNSFDRVTSSGAFPMVPNPNKALDEMYRVSKKGGKLSLGAGIQPNNPNFQTRLVMKILDRLLKKYHIDIDWFKEDELVTQIEKAGFEDVQYRHLGGILCVVKGKK